MKGPRWFEANWSSYPSSESVFSERAMIPALLMRLDGGNEEGNSESASEGRPEGALLEATKYPTREQTHTSMGISQLKTSSAAFLLVSNVAKSRIKTFVSTSGAACLISS